MEDLVRYLDEIVDPTGKELEADRTSVRKAFLTCVAIFHSIDYLAHPRKRGNLKKLWRQQSSDFALVDDVAHAVKHVVANGQNRLKVTDVILRPPLAYGVIGTYGLSRYGDLIGGVTLADDPTVDILDVIRQAVRSCASKPRALPLHGNADSNGQKGLLRCGRMVEHAALYWNPARCRENPTMRFTGRTKDPDKDTAYRGVSCPVRSGSSPDNTIMSGHVRSHT